MEIHIIHEKIAKYVEKIVINIFPSQHDLGNFNKDDRETIQSANQSINSNLAGMQIVQDEINWGIQHELIVFWAIFTEWPTNSKQFT
jgi:hypothetical protein